MSPLGQWVSLYCQTSTELLQWPRGSHPLATTTITKSQAQSPRPHPTDLSASAHPISIRPDVRSAIRCSRSQVMPPFPPSSRFLFIQGFQAGSSPSSSWPASLPPGDQNLLTPNSFRADIHRLSQSSRQHTANHLPSTIIRYDCTPLTKKKNGPSDQGFFHFRCEKGAVPDMSLVITLSVTH